MRFDNSIEVTVRPDYQSAINAVDRACDDLPSEGETLPASGRLTATIYQCTKALFENPLVVAAIDAEVSARVRGRELAQKAARSLFDSVLGHLQQINVRLVESRKTAEAQVGRDSALDTLKLLDQTVAWRGRQVATSSVLHEFEEPFPDHSGITIADVKGLYETVIVRAERAIDALLRLKPERTALEDDGWMYAPIKAARTELAAGLRHLDLVRDFLDSEGLYGVDFLKQLHLRLREVSILGASLPLAADDPLHSLGEETGCLRVIYCVETVAALVRARLRARGVRLHVIARLKTYIERFARKEIRAKLNTRKPRGKFPAPEQILQFEVDRFVFSEGLFPITHAVAGTGRIDTFFEQSRPLFDEAAELGQGSVLIELKQAVGNDANPNVTEGKVETAINEALLQADEYKSHLVAEPRWSDQEVVALVVYGGKRRYSTDRPGVVLVYLGDSPPSAGSKLICEASSRRAAAKKSAEVPGRN